MLERIMLIALLMLSFSGCKEIDLEEIEPCSIAGIMIAGADCVKSISGKKRKITFDEVIEMLEPNEELGRGGGVFMSISDYVKIKTFVEQACYVLGDKCTVKMKETIKNLGRVTNKETEMKKIFSIPYLGQVSPDVKTVQQQVNLIGGFKLKEDGIFGPKLKAAISSIQKKNKLTGTGVIGPITLRLLDIEVVSMSGASITKDLKGKKARILYPTLRFLMEGQIFPGGKIPEAFKAKNVPEMAVLTLEGMERLKIREEGGNNKGEKVGFVQSVIGTVTTKGDGAAWCMSEMQCVIAFIEDYLQEESPVLDSEHCVTVFNHAKKNGLLAPACERGSMWIARNGTSQSGHTGGVIRVVSAKKMDTIEGNTGSSSIRDGDGLYPRTRNIDKNGSLVTLGFVRLYPNNKAA